MRLLLKDIKLERLYHKLNYTFKDKTLIINALTHRSRGSQNNERLEFLGDSLLSCVIAEGVYQRFPNATEGEMSRLRAYLVKGETLARIAKELSLGEHIQLGQGELKSGGFRRESILADCLEAMFAAVYLDAGFEQCRTVIRAMYETRLNDNLLLEKTKDPKTLLQELLQAQKYELPTYELIKVTGKQHNQLFVVTCYVEKLGQKTLGKATTRRKAEKQAAEKMLQVLDEAGSLTH